MGVSPKIRGKPPKMDGLFHEKPYEQMGWFGGVFPYFWFNTHIDTKNPWKLRWNPKNPWDVIMDGTMEP